MTTDINSILSTLPRTTHIADSVSGVVTLHRDCHAGLSAAEYCAIMVNDLDNNLPKLGVEPSKYLYQLHYHLKYSFRVARRNASNMAALACMVAHDNALAANGDARAAMVETRMHGLKIVVSAMENYQVAYQSHIDALADAGYSEKIPLFEIPFQMEAFQDWSVEHNDDIDDDDDPIDDAHRLDYGATAQSSQARDDGKVTWHPATAEDWIAFEMGKSLSEIEEGSRFAAHAKKRELHEELMSTHLGTVENVFTTYDGSIRIPTNISAFFIKLMHKMTDYQARSESLDLMIEYLINRNDNESFDAYTMRVVSNHCVAAMNAAMDDEKIMDLKCRQQELELALSNLTSYVDAFKVLIPYLKFDNPVSSYQRWFLHDPAKFLARRLKVVHPHKSMEALTTLAKASFGDGAVFDSLTIGGENEEYLKKKELAESLGYTLAPQSGKAEPAKTLYRVSLFGLSDAECITASRDLSATSFEMNKHYQGKTAGERTMESRSNEDTTRPDADTAKYVSSAFEDTIDSLIFNFK